MKTFLSVAVISCTLFSGSLIIVNSNGVENAKKEVSPAVKWGVIAMQKTNLEYLKASIIDYFHIGREEGINASIEKFKSWLREKKFGVRLGERPRYLK